MGLGYLILSIKSEQDKYLTGNPQFTFFKSVYKRHTNFAVDYQFISFVGDSNNVFGKKVYIDIPKNGDLLHRMFLMIDIKGTAGLQKITPTVYQFIEYIDLFIGGQRIDRHYGNWLQIWHELYEKNDVALGKLVSSQPEDTSADTNTVYLPLRFWFNNNVGLSLPLIALQYNDIKLEIKFNNKSEIQTYSRHSATITDNPVLDTAIEIKKVQMLTEYVHLDKEERRLFASNVHEYLITQVQTSLSNPTILSTDERVQKTDLRFNHPVKELVWTFQDYQGNIGSRSNPADTNIIYYADGVLKHNFWRGFKYGQDHFLGATLNLNGKDMTDELPPSFYRSLQNFQFHSGVGLGSIRDKTNDVAANNQAPKETGITNGNAIYSYSFSLSPEEFQPSGSINFSNIEQAQLKYRFKNYTSDEKLKTVSKKLDIYAVNYNILRVMSGMASLAFSN